MIPKSDAIASLVSDMFLSSRGLSSPRLVCHDLYESELSLPQGNGWSHVRRERVSSISLCRQRMKSDESLELELKSYVECSGVKPIHLL